MSDLTLPRPPAAYNSVLESQRNEALEKADRNNLKRWEALTMDGVNIDGGTPTSVYGSIPSIDGGGI